MAGQTVRGKGSKGPRCPGEGDPRLQQCSHQASGYGPGPAKVRSQCAQRSAARTKGSGDGCTLAEQLGPAYGSSGFQKSATRPCVSKRGGKESEQVHLHI